MFFYIVGLISMISITLFRMKIENEIYEKNNFSEENRKRLLKETFVFGLVFAFTPVLNFIFAIGTAIKSITMKKMEKTDICVISILFSKFFDTFFEKIIK